MIGKEVESRYLKDIRKLMVRREFALMKAKKDYLSLIVPFKKDYDRKTDAINKEHTRAIRKIYGKLEGK